MVDLSNIVCEKKFIYISAFMSPDKHQRAILLVQCTTISGTLFIYSVSEYVNSILGVKFIHL